MLRQCVCPWQVRQSMDNGTPTAAAPGKKGGKAPQPKKGKGAQPAEPITAQPILTTALTAQPTAAHTLITALTAKATAPQTLTVNSNGRQVVTVLPTAGGVVGARQQVFTLTNSPPGLVAVSTVAPGVTTGGVVTVLTQGGAQSLLQASLTPPPQPTVVVLPSTPSVPPPSVLPMAQVQPLMSPVSNAGVNNTDHTLLGSKTIANLLRQKHPSVSQVSHILFGGKSLAFCYFYFLSA